MNSFPLFADWTERRCLVVGGGRLALHRVELLLEAQASVTVVSDAFLPALLTLPVCRIERKVSEEDCRDMLLVVNATGDESVSRQLGAFCAQNGIWFNDVNDPDRCTLQFPAMLKRGDLTAAVSTHGASPTAAAWARDRLNEALPDAFEEMLVRLRALRSMAKTQIPDQNRRRILLRDAFEVMLSRGAALSEAELAALCEGDAERRSGGTRRATEDV